MIAALVEAVLVGGAFEIWLMPHHDPRVNAAVRHVLRRSFYVDVETKVHILLEDLHR